MRPVGRTRVDRPRRFIGEPACRQLSSTQIIVELSASAPGRGGSGALLRWSAYRPRPTRCRADGRVENGTQARRRGDPDERHRQHQVRAPLREQGRGRQRRLDSAQGGGPSGQRGGSARCPWISLIPRSISARRSQPPYARQVEEYLNSRVYDREGEACPRRPHLPSKPAPPRAR